MAITSFRAGEAISAGDAVSLNTAGVLFKASALTFEQASTIGIAIDSGSAGSLIRVNNDNIYTSASGLTPGQINYVSVLTSGSFIPYANWETELSLTIFNGAYLAPVGRALATNAIDVEVSKPIFISNPTSVFLLEDSGSPFLDAILQEDGSTISLETA
jgi:hypothetical protein